MSQLRTIFLGGPPPPPFFEEMGPDFPDQDLISMDDVQIEEIGRRLKVPFAETKLEPVKKTGYSNTFMIYDHPTHWLMFNRYFDYPDPKDNGYTLSGWRKSTCSETGFEQHLKEWLVKRQVDPITVVRINDVPPAP